MSKVKVKAKPRAKEGPKPQSKAAYERSERAEFKRLYPEQHAKEQKQLKEIRAKNRADIYGEGVITRGKNKGLKKGTLKIKKNK